MTPSWAPTSDEVHAVIPTRARQQPFNETSVPTVAEVRSIIEQICTEVVAEVGPFDPSKNLSHSADDAQRTVGDMARWAATLGAASTVELGFFPEQQTLGDTTPGQILYQRYQQALARLKASIEAIATAEDPPTEPRYVTGSITTPLPAVASLRGRAPGAC